MNTPLKVGDVLGIRRVAEVLAPVQQGDARNRMYRWACVACGKCGRTESTDARARHNEVARRSAAKRRLERGEELRKYDRDLKRRRRAELKAARA